jgi:hypothetical protein
MLITFLLVLIIIVIIVLIHVAINYWLLNVKYSHLRLVAKYNFSNQRLVDKYTKEATDGGLLEL